VTPARGLVLDRRGEPPTLQELEVAKPGAGEVRVRMVAAGLCHTDVSSVRDARSVPLVLGHEGAGVVESVGAGVAFATGAPVLLCWKVPCGRCRRCRVGDAHLCEEVVGLEGPRCFRDGEPVPPLLNAGCFCELVVVPAAACVALEGDLPFEQAALVGCAVATGVGAVLRTARVRPEESIAVFGAGGVGLNVVSGALLAGARRIVAVDPDPGRREGALARGATEALAPEEAGELGVDHAFEAVGHPDVMAQALAALAPGGQLVLIGASARDALLSFHPRAFMSRQQRIVGCIYGSLRPHVDLPVLLRLAAQGRLPLADLVGARIGLDGLPRAFVDPPAGGVRTVVSF
jgi:S-(hydroxymethyl)glutathione dehydrogenase/alcohol dehydrogenase